MRNICARLPEGAILVIFAGNSTCLPAESIKIFVDAAWGAGLSLREAAFRPFPEYIRRKIMNP
jgi:hypothetical protein